MTRLRPLSHVHRQGLSIVELMIAITISLIVLVVMMQAFRRASGEIKKGRSMIEMASEMRAVGETFRRDLANLTVSPRVWNLSGEANGYFEIIEGLRSDASYPRFGTDVADNDGDGATDEVDEVSVGSSMTAAGDLDDVIAMTVRSGDKPFRGRWIDAGGNTQIVESHVAEIVWFVQIEDIDDTPSPPNPMADMDDRVTLYRRVLLVRPDLALYLPAAPDDNVDGFFRLNDISARDVGGVMIANSLSDLTLRENRYARLPVVRPPPPSNFPYEIQRTMLGDRRVPTGDDILLTNVAGFDLRVYSPNAPIKLPNNSQFLEPNDPNYVINTSAAVAEGGYVDLGWGGLFDLIDNDNDGLVDEADEDLSTHWFSVKQYAPVGLERTWDSWSPHYLNEPAANGLDDDGDLAIDEWDEATATNGLDDDGDGIVDEEDEANGYLAPYPYPIRALQLTMRGIEKSTRNIRQVTITSSFVPE